MAKGISPQYVATQLATSAHAAQVRTLNAHCHTLYPGNASNAFSPVRGALRKVNMGAFSNGASRYPALPGSAYAAALTAALSGASPDATAHAVAQAMAKVQRTVWGAKGTPQPVQDATAQRVAVAKAAAKGAKQGKGQAQRAAAAQPAPASTDSTVQGAS